MNHLINKLYYPYMAESGRENWAVDELLKAEEDANAIIKNA